MKLQNAIRIPVPADQAWSVLLDIERIAPCVPGATLTTHEGDLYQGKVKVKLGPISLSYSGSVHFVSLDEVARVAVMEASGRETRGGGTAKAVVICRLTDLGDVTDVVVDTDLAITGRPAQFGRAALADVATTMIDQFAANLSDEIAPAPSGAAGGSVVTDAVPAPPGGLVAVAEPIDLLRATRAGQRLGPAIAALLLTMLLVNLGVRIIRRRHQPGKRMR